jgi:hypothetical protein
MAWSVFTAPAAAGRRVRAVTTYQDQFIQLGVRYTDFGGHDFYGEIINAQVDGQYFVFAQPIPTAVDLWVFPNFAVTMFWLVVL